VMDRLVLNDAAWERMAPLIIGRPDQKGSTGRDNRMFVEGVLWIVRTGSPWRDLPEAFGDWNSVFRRFSRWSIRVFGGGTAGQKGDAPQAAALIEGLPAEVVMADTAYDADHLRQAIAAKLAVIPNNPSRALKYPLDKHLYAQRHLVECCFSKLKQFRRVATRFEKAARNYRAVVTLAAIILWMR
jgi:transposase